MPLEWRNADLPMRRLPGTWAKFSEAAGKTLLQEARAILAEAKRRTPYQTGRLRNSGYVRKINLAGGGYTVIIGFDTPYAMRVHEDLYAFHPIGQAKYLEEPFKMAAASMKARLEAGARNALR